MFSSNHNKTSFLPRFEISYPNKSRTFSPEQNKVQGKVEIQLLNEASNIVSIEIGLKGESKTIQSIATTTKNSGSRLFSKSSKKPTAHKDERSRLDVFFNQTSNVFKSDAKKGATFPEGYWFEYPFEFTFPTSELVLPSSCNSLGDGSGNISVRYDVYIRIQYLTDGNELATSLDFLAPLDFQSTTPISIADLKISSVEISSEQVYKDKSKAYLPDPVFGGMISNKPNGGPAKFMKKNWNSKYSQQLTVKSDIKLGLTLELPSPLKLDSVIGNIPVRIEASAPGLTPQDFACKGMSTRLGYFEVQSLELSMTQIIQLAVARTSLSPYSKTTKTDIAKERFSLRPSFDLKDFSYNEKSQTYVFNTTLAYFTKDQTTTFFEKITKTVPLMNAVKLGDFFECENTLCLSMSIGTGQKQSGRESSGDARSNNKTFEFSLPHVILVSSSVPSAIPTISYPATANHNARMFDPNSPNAEATDVYNSGYYSKYNNVNMESGAGMAAAGGAALGATMAF